MNKKNKEFLSSDSTIRFAKTLPKDLEKRREREHIAHEASKGITCNFKQFFMLIENKSHDVVGILEAYTAFAEIYVEDLWVDEKHRRQGYGTKLIKALEKHFEKKGYNNINLVTSNFSAPDFYKKCGYQVEFVRANPLNPQLTKTFFVKYFDEEAQTQGILTHSSIDENNSSYNANESIVYSEELATQELEEKIYEGFTQHALQTIGHDVEITRFAFVARQHNKVIGAIVFKTFWGALHIQYLWVAEEQRGNGIGSSLIKHALEKGRKLRCPFAYLETMNFQAVNFYKNLGFKENFVRHGYAHGTSFHYLQKMLHTEKTERSDP